MRRFYTASDQQDYVVVEVHQGENTYAQDNLLLGKIEISVPPKPKGKEAVDVRFTYDINGILMVVFTESMSFSIWKQLKQTERTENDRVSGKQQKISLDRKNRLQQIRYIRQMSEIRPRDPLKM